MLAPMSDIPSHVLEQMHRIHRAVNDGTVNKDEVNDALAMLHHILSGAADEPADETDDETDPPEDHVVHKRAPRKKR